MTAAVAGYAHTHVEAERAAVTDVRAVESTATRILFALGVRDVRLEAQGLGHRMLEIDADLVGAQLTMFGSAVQVERRAGLPIVGHRSVVVELHAAQVVE